MMRCSQIFSVVAAVLLIAGLSYSGERTGSRKLTQYPTPIPQYPATVSPTGGNCVGGVCSVPTIQAPTNYPVVIQDWSTVAGSGNCANGSCGTTAAPVRRGLFRR